MCQQSVRQAVRRPALDARAAMRTVPCRPRTPPRRSGGRGADRSVNVMLMVREAERRAGRALLAMTDDEGLSLRGAVDWCGNGVTVRKMTRLRRMAQEDPGANGPMNARHVTVGPQRRVVRT